MSITKDDIPPEVVEAGKDAAFVQIRTHIEDNVRVNSMTDEELGGIVSAAILAALAAWPGAWQQHITSPTLARPHCILLPLPQTRKSGTYDAEFGKLWA